MVEDMTLEEVEKRLEGLLRRLELPKAVTVEEIKDVIWNEQRSGGSSELFGMLAPYAKDEEMVQEVMKVVQDAWNYFPHRVLGGKSPADLVKEYQETGKIDESKRVTLPKRGKPLTEVLEDRFPKAVVFERVSEDSWGWGFPKLYHDLTEELWELEERRPSPQVFEKELYRMIKQMPELFDAVNDLANVYRKRRELGLAKALYEQTIARARGYIPETFVRGKDRAIWPYLENRPFLRMLAGYAILVEEMEGAGKAIPLYEEILAFNPNDNQGIRGIVSTAYLRAGEPESVLELASHYDDYMTPELTMGKFLAFLQMGEMEKAASFLEEIKGYQEHTIKELLKGAHFPPATLMPDRVRWGGEDEAWLYWQSQGKLWEQVPGAIEFLREQTKEIQEKIVTLTDEEVLRVGFFHDFLVLLKRLKERPIKLTATGNISLKDIESMLQATKLVRDILEDNQKEWGLRPRKEDEILPLHLMRVVAEIMHLIYKRQGKLLLSKNGKGFLEGIAPVDQFGQLFQYYAKKFDWRYYMYGTEKQERLTELLQMHQVFIWRLIKEKGSEWIDYKVFCAELRDQFRLEPFLEESYSNPEEVLERRVEGVLFGRLLSLFGCVELETKEISPWNTAIVRFRLSRVGWAVLS